MKKAYPTSTMSFRAAIGNTTPPRLAPDDERANAIPLFVVNHCDTTLTQGPITAPLASCIHVLSDGVVQQARKLGR